MNEAEAHAADNRFPAAGWRRRACLLALLCWAGFAIMFGLIETGHVQAFDAAGLTMWRRGAELARLLGPGWLPEAVRDYTALGSALLRNIFALCAVAAFLFLQRRREAVLYFATVASGWLLADAIKTLVQRPRPAIVPHLVHAGGSSFPSAHSFNSAVVYITMALAFAALSPRRAVRSTLIVGAVVLTLLVALSRVWLGVHNPSDVIAGWLGGVGWALLASAILTARSRPLVSMPAFLGGA